MDPTAPPLEYFHRSHQNVTDIETRALQNVQSLVEANYVKGRPRHHLQQSRQVEYTEDTSIFFIVDYKDYMKMSQEDIHRVARLRHIVIRGAPAPQHTWSLSTLSLTGSISQPRDVQGTRLVLIPQHISHTSPSG